MADGSDWSREPQPDVTPTVRWRWLAGCVLLVGLALHGTMILIARPLLSANDRSRWCTVWSLVERQTYRIDEIRQKPGWDTIDLVYDDGHFYSTKPPILATWVAGIVWCLGRVTGWTLLKDTQAMTTTTQLIANGIPLLVSWMLLARLLRQTMTSDWGRALLLIVGVFGTLLTPFAVTLNNHTIAAAGAMVTVYALWKILHFSPSGGREPPESGVSSTAASIQRADAPRSEDGQVSWCDFALCGFAAGWTCAHELPAAPLGVATFLLCLWRDPKKTLLGYVPAAAFPLAFFFITNWLATGGLKPAYADYGTEKYRFMIEGVPSYWLEPKGIDRNVDKPLVYVLHCLVGHHGLFSLTPVWLLLIPAWVMSGLALRASGIRKAQAIIAAVSLLLTVVVLAFYFSRIENYNYGGVSCGLRWALWLTPLWIVTLIPVFDRCADSRGFRWLFVPLFLVSAFSAWSRVDNPWRHPWLYTWMESRRWIDYSEPRRELPHDLWTWIAAVPDCRDGAERWTEFTGAASLLESRGPARMRLTASPANDLVALQITKSRGGEETETVLQVEVNREKLLAGAKPSEFLRWPNPEITAAQQQADLAFLRGLPQLRQFSPGVIRYRKLPLRTDAFRCQHAFAQVDVDAPAGGRKWRYRCDAWLCEELPFGVAEVEFQVHDLASGLMLHQERWQASACEPPPLPHAQWSPLP